MLRSVGRFQELYLEADSTYVARAPAAVAAAAAAAERAGAPPPSLAFAASAELEGIDHYAAEVLAEPDARAAVREPLMEAAAWLQPEIRAAILRAVKPMRRGGGVLADEVRSRFELALAFLQTLNGHAQTGAVIGLADVQAVAVIYGRTIY